MYYLVQYTSIFGTYSCNRVDEKITEEDRTVYDRGELPTLVYFLQSFHVFLYGWQDKAIESSDRLASRFAARGSPQRISRDNWYGDKVFLTLISPLCLCTNNMLLVFFSLADAIEQGFWLVVVVGNSYLFFLQAWKTIKTRNSLAL